MHSQIKNVSIASDLMDSTVDECFFPLLLVLRNRDQENGGDQRANGHERPFSTKTKSSPVHAPAPRLPSRFRLPAAGTTRLSTRDQTGSWFAAVFDRSPPIPGCEDRS